MRHIGTVTYYDSEKKFAYVDENGTSYTIGTKIVQDLPDPDMLLRRGNTVFFSVVPNKQPGKKDYATNITRVVESFSPRVSRTDGEKKLLEIFQSSQWLSGWTILEQPYINGLHPDFVLIHPRKGVVIVEVKDWNLTDTQRYSEGKVLGNDGQYYDVNPAYQLEKYSTYLSDLNFLEPEGFREHIWNTTRVINDLEDDPNKKEKILKNYPIFSNVVFFSGAGITLEQARQFSPNTPFVWTCKEAEYLLDPNHTFSNCKEYPWSLRLFGYGKIEKPTRYYSMAPKTKDGTNIFWEYLRRLICWMDGTDYEKSRKKPYQLTQAQQVLAKHAPGECRVCEGVTGSGKSLILAEKAADAILSKRRVLVLTYNITLTNYLHDLCRQQFQGDSRAFNQLLTVDYFHSTLRDCLHNCNMPIKSEHINKEDASAKEFSLHMNDYTTKAIEQIYQCSGKVSFTRYDDVLIDEGNDFCDYEIAFLKDIVYNGTGEFLVMSDPAHRIYSELNPSGLWGENPASLGLKKVTLNHSYCAPQKVRELLEKVQETFQLPGLSIEPDPDSDSDQSYGSVRWIDCDETSFNQRILSELSYWLKDKEVHPEDLILVTVDYRSAQKLAEILTCAGLPVQLCGNSRSSKQRFWAGKNNLKVTTYHNIKGWHAPYVMLVLQAGSAPEEKLAQSSVLNAFCVALSRVKPTIDTHKYCFRCFNCLDDEWTRPLAALTISS